MPNEEYDSQGARIIFADDDESVYGFVEAILENCYKGLHNLVGYTTGTALSERLDAEVEKPTGLAVVLTDNQMPGPNGMDIIETYSPRLPNTRFILHSGDNISKEEVLAIGGHESLKKPTGMAEMKAAVDSAIESRKA